MPQTDRFFELLEAHDGWVDLRAAKLRVNLEKMALKASAKTAIEIRNLASAQGLIVDGQITQSPATQRILRRADSIFIEILDGLGYREEIEGFAGVMAAPGSDLAIKDTQLKFFDDTFAEINKRLKTPLEPPRWRKEDARLFSSKKLTSIKALENEVGIIATESASQTMVSFGAVGQRELTGILAEQFGSSWGRVEALSTTTLTAHYRTLHRQAYRLIEEQQDVGPLKLVYAGPRDKLNRPFCRRTLANNKPRTEKQINRLNAKPSKLRPIMTAGGGFNCRHIWVIAGDDE